MNAGFAELKGSPYRLLLPLGLAFIAWIVGATVIVPAVIRSAYRGESLSLLNALIEGRATYPVGFYEGMWLTFAGRATAAVLAGAGVALIVSRPWFYQRCVGPATPAALGAIRILTCAVLLVTTSWEDLGSIALLPADMRRPAGPIDALLSLSIGHQLTNAAILAGLQLTTELLLVIGMLGLMTRVVLPLATVAHFISLGLLVEYSFFWHQGLVPLYLLAVLSCLPCGDGLSLDSVMRRRRGTPVSPAPAAIYGWGRYACWLVIVLPYVQSGVSKLRIGGLAWLSPVNMRSMLYLDTLSPREYDWQLSLHLTSAPDVLFLALGVSTIVLEIGYAAVLFAPLARRVLPWVMVGVHLGIFALQRILFFDLIVLQLAFVDVATVQRFGRALLAYLPTRQTGDSSAAVPAVRHYHALRARFALSIGAIVAVSTACWLMRIEYYPLTAWHLYANADTSGVVTYLRVLGRDDSGRIVSTRLEDGIGAVALDGRYMNAVGKCFGRTDEQEVCAGYLAANGRVHNARRETQVPLAAYQIEKWTWNFVASPDDPRHGQRTDSVVVAVSGRPGVAARLQLPVTDR